MTSVDVSKSSLRDSGTVQVRVKRSHTILLALALVALAVVPYLQTLRHNFVHYDDTLYVTKNAFVQRGLTWELFTWSFTAMDASNWHPLTWLSHALDCTLYRQADGSQWPGGHHLSNIVIHAINTLLVWIVLASLTGARWRSALVSALFAVHPLHVESVAWVAERKDVLSTLFGLLALWNYSRYAQRGGALRYLGVLLCFALSLMCKAMWVTLPCVLLLLDIWPLGRWRLWQWNVDGMPARARGQSWDRILLEKVPLLLMSTVVSILTIRAQHGGSAITSFSAMPLQARIANAVTAYIQYLNKTFIPTGLAAIYPHPGIRPLASVALSMLVLVIVTVVVIMRRRHQPWLLTGWLWFLGTLVPVIGLVQVGMQSMADRYMYVPIIGIFIMVAWTIPAPPSASIVARRCVTAAACALVLVLAALTWLQTRTWIDSHALFNRAIAVIPANYAARQQLAHLHVFEGDLDQAVAEYQRAIEDYPRFAPLYENLANALVLKGDLNAAIEQLNLAVQYNPRSTAAFNLIGEALMRQQRYREAEAPLRRAIDIAPDHIQARENLGAVLFQIGHMDEAIPELTIVLHVWPDHHAARINLARALAATGRTEQAVAEMRIVLAAEPGNAGARELLVELERGLPK